MYQNSQFDDLIIGFKRHLTIAQDTTLPKSKRLSSLKNLQEAAEYVVTDINNQLPEELRVILTRFFPTLLIKIVQAQCAIHTDPVRFDQEISFLSVLSTLVA